MVMMMVMVTTCPVRKIMALTTTRLRAAPANDAALKSTSTGNVLTRGSKESRASEWTASSKRRQERCGSE